MTPSLEQLKNTLSALPRTEREELADYLFSTLEFEDEVKAEWLTLAEQRLEDLRSGQAVGVPADEVLKGLLGPEK